MWHKEQKWQPTNGQGYCEIAALPMGNGQLQEIITNRLIVLMMSEMCE
jgi:hypothetical protein